MPGLPRTGAKATRRLAKLYIDEHKELHVENSQPFETLLNLQAGANAPP